MTCFCGCLCELHCTITCFFLKLWKKIREMACLLLSFGAGTNLFALFFGDSVIFFLWFKMLKFLWIYFTATKKFKKKEKLQAKCDFIILRGIIHKTPPFSNGVQLSANTENQIYSTLCIGSVIIYPSVITMRKSLCYHHRMTIFENT